MFDRVVRESKDQPDAIDKKAEEQVEASGRPTIKLVINPRESQKSKGG